MTMTMTSIMVMIDDGDDDDHPALHSLPCEENVGRVVQHNLKQEMSI